MLRIPATVSCNKNCANESALHARASGRRAQSKDIGKQMKEIIIILVSIVLIGCTTNKPVLLDTPEHMQPNVALNPSLSIPDNGFHPYLGLSLGLEPDDLANNSYMYQYIGINGGMLYQSSIEKEISLAFFSSLNFDLNYSSFKMTPTGKTKERLSREDINVISKDSFAFSGELSLKSGPCIRLYPCVLSIYGIGAIQFEKGSYSELREEINTIAKYYNLETRSVSYGAGYGIDISFGKTRKGDGGVYIENRYFYLNPQSDYSDFWDDYIRNESSTKSYVYTDNGRLILKHACLGAYADYEQSRFLLTLSNGISLNIIYKFL
jgi:hypothetical protein